MQLLSPFLVFILILSGINNTYAGDRLEYNQFEIYADTIDLSFKELSSAESQGKIVFGQFHGLSDEVQIYWIKIDGQVLQGADYVFLSDYFERIEAYYSGQTSPFSISGKLVDFEDRTYKKGFYRNVVALKKTEGPVYIKLITKRTYGIKNRSLSHIEVSSDQNLQKQSSLIFTSFTLLIGMGVIILIINIGLVYLRPSFETAFYSLFILSGMLMSNYQNQVLINLFGIPAMVNHYIELVIGILIIYGYNAFSAFYLKAIRYSKALHFFLVTPYCLLFLFLALGKNDTYFPITATIFFISTQLAVFYLLFRAWKEDPYRVKVFLFANGLVLLAGFVKVMALNDLVPHHFITTNAVYFGFMLRDTVFTVNLIHHYFSVQNDSVRRKVKIEQLEEEKEQLKRIEELKTRFFNNVSHELRTPLTLILSPLENALKNGKVSDTIKKDLNLSLKNGKYLLQLVNEMLDLTKLDKGELELFRQPTNVVQVIKEITETFDSYGKEKGQSIQITHTSQSVVAMVDQDKFEKIIINLLSNAIKYNDKPGKISIQINEIDNTLEIVVTDEGRGISKKEISKIFDRYFQSEEVNSEEGTGIGLSIVKEFMELHQGHVTCSSQIGKGSTFTLCFPKAIQPSKSQIVSEDETILLDQSKSTLLLVEDHSDMRSYLTTKLGQYNIIEASDGEQALQKMSGGLMPDLILTDYVMPNLNGYELAKRIKNEDKWTNIPIIFLTARTLGIDKMEVLNLGVDDYIIKPFDLEELKVRIKNLIDVSSQRIEFSKSTIPDLSLDKQKSFKVELDEYILQNLKNIQLSNTELAHRFAISERNLFRRIKLVTGQSPAYYIREIRLQKARLMLESETEMSISQISLECGIDNLTHFSQAFKKRFGKTPSSLKEFTKEHLNTSTNS